MSIQICLTYKQNVWIQVNAVIGKSAGPTASPNITNIWVELIVLTPYRIDVRGINGTGHIT